MSKRLKDSGLGTSSFTCPHSGYRRIVCILTHQFLKALPVIAVATLALFAIAIISQKAFYHFMPAKTFLTITSADVPTTRLGEPMILTLCRNTWGVGNLKADGIRTFFRVIDDEAPRGVSSYEFKPDIEAKDGCQSVTIPSNKYPKEAGTYYMYTTVAFRVDGNYKEVGYQTPPFLISDTQRTTDQKIEELQKQIDTLQASK